MGNGTLNESELQAWRGLMLMGFRLTATLSRELADATGLSYPDYVVLAVLSDRQDGRMRAFELGRALGWEKSRLSHHVARMAERGLVRREKCKTDQRGAFVAVTPRGRKAVAAAAPVHAAVVRRHFVDVLSAAELATIGEVAGRVLDQLGPSS
jgi:DNA-binding MarR family transcriptional regulator